MSSNFQGRNFGRKANSRQLLIWIIFVIQTFSMLYGIGWFHRSNIVLSLDVHGIVSSSTRGAKLLKGNDEASSSSTGSHIHDAYNNQQHLRRRTSSIADNDSHDDENDNNSNNVDGPTDPDEENEQEQPLRFAFLEDVIDSEINNKENDSRIIDGKEIPDDRYLYLVALFKKDNKGYLTHMCGGVIVSPNYVLTAAHCLANTDVVVTGLKDYRNVMPGTYERFDVTQDNFIPHPNYSTSTLDSDFALIELTRQTRFPALTINFNEQIPQDKQLMTVMGWGYLRNNQAGSMANEAVLEHVDMIKCRAKWGTSTIKDSMVCATGHGIVDTCQGDSGGPMIIKNTKDSEDRLIGLTSWGAGCADATYPGVYSRVSYTKEWMKIIIPSLFDSNGNPIQPAPSSTTTSSSSSSSSNTNSGGTSASNTSPGTSTTETTAEVGCAIETQCVTIMFVYNWCYDVCV